jgi:hypothetical protein
MRMSLFLLYLPDLKRKVLWKSVLQKKTLYVMTYESYDDDNVIALDKSKFSLRYTNFFCVSIT